MVPTAPRSHCPAMPSSALAARFVTGDEILSLACSPDGKYLASGGRNDMVRYASADGRLVRVFNERWVWNWLSRRTANTW